MKSKRKCNDCGGEMDCYRTVPKTINSRVQFFICQSCKLKMRLVNLVVTTHLKRVNEKVFSIPTATTSGEGESGS